MQTWTRKICCLASEFVSGTLISSPAHPSAVRSTLFSPPRPPHGRSFRKEEMITAASHLHLYLCRRLFPNRWMCCEDVETGMQSRKHVVIINSLAALRFFQEPWNQNPENTIPALITHFTNLVSPLRLLNPPLFFYHFTLFSLSLSLHSFIPPLWFFCSKRVEMIVFGAL